MQFLVKLSFQKQIKQIKTDKFEISYLIKMKTKGYLKWIKITWIKYYEDI